jgi:methyltransferase-like protein
LVVRSQAERDDIVANLRHECVPLDELQQALLPLLDGTRDREALADALAAMVADGRLSLGEAPEGEEGDVRARLERGLEELLAGLAQSALLVSEDRSHSVHL